MVKIIVKISPQEQSTESVSTTFTAHIFVSVALNSRP